MARITFGLNQTLDGWVDHDVFAPDPELFAHFIAHAGTVAGGVYGRRTYELMQYWDEDQPEWGAAERAFAEVWRRQPKWVVSGTLPSVGPGATLVRGDLERLVRRLKGEVDGEIEVAGPALAGSLTALGLIDEYRIYLHPLVTGRGQPFFVTPPPPLRLVANDRIGPDVIRLAYVPG